MKKIITLLFVIVVCVETAFALKVKIDMLYYNLDLDNFTAEVSTTGPTNYSGDIVIPESVLFNDVNYSVTSIEGGAFDGCYDMTSVIIPNSIKSIGWSAFNGCSALTAVEIPSSVTYIEDNVFEGCSGLSSIVVSSGNIKYDSRNNCNAIIETATNKLLSGCKNTLIPNNVTSIGQHAFSNCSAITNIIIPNSVSSIEHYAFSNCTNLTSIEIPSSVSNIREGVFYWCTNLSDIVVADGNSVYDSRDHCKAVIETATNTLIIGCKSTTIPNTVTSIGYEAFRGCTTMTNIVIPNSVTYVGKNAFFQCFGLTDVSLPSSVTIIDKWAFSHCTGLKSVFIPNSVTSIGEYAFAHCSSLTSFTNYAETPQVISENVFYNTDKNNCTLYVPNASIDLYNATDVWKDFNIAALTEVNEGKYSIHYADKENAELYQETLTLHVPGAPVIDGFTFVGWEVVAGQLIDGIVVQAVYTANEPTSSPEVVNPANKVQKLIRSGNVYILTDTKAYTVQGQEVR